MSTACRLFLNRGRISTRRLRKVSPLTSRKKSTSTVSSSPLARERVPVTSRAETPVHRHSHVFALVPLRQALGPIGEFLEGRNRPAQKAEALLQFGNPSGQLL